MLPRRDEIASCGPAPPPRCWRPFQHAGSTTSARQGLAGPQRAAGWRYFDFSAYLRFAVVRVVDTGRRRKGPCQRVRRGQGPLLGDLGAHDRHRERPNGRAAPRSEKGQRVASRNRRAWTLEGGVRRGRRDADPGVARTGRRRRSPKPRPAHRVVLDGGHGVEAGERGSEHCESPTSVATRGGGGRRTNVVPSSLSFFSSFFSKSAALTKPQHLARHTNSASFDATLGKERGAAVERSVDGLSWAAS